jgi:adhesin transport system outer membrane protein
VDSIKRDLTDRLNADYNEYEFSQLKMESLKQSVNLTNDISASYDRQYLVGKKSWLDLMNAVRERAQTRQALADAQGSLLASSRRLLVYIDGTARFDITPDLPKK